MKKSHTLVLTLFLMILASCTSKEIVLSDWMQNLPDETRLCKLSIPATHDSGALLGGEALQTQDITISQQLEGGIRGFDIRLQADSNGKLGVYHSIQYQNITWEDNVLPDFIHFLQKHPGETLIVSVKKEDGDSQGYRDLLTASLKNPAHTAYFVQDFRGDLTLGECRGKIVFLHRTSIGSEYPGAFCTDWADNDTFDMPLQGANGTQGESSIEDIYSYKNAGSSSYKADITFANMKAAMESPKTSNKWFLSFASATALPVDGPKDFSDVVNASLIQKLQGVNQPCGIVLIDFAGSEDGKTLTRLLIENN